MMITVEKTKTPKSKPASDQLVFGKSFSDHMFICDYSEEMDGIMRELFLTKI